MDKEENVFKISEFISKSLDDCLEEGELQELEKWLTEDERHRELFALWSSTELMERKAEVYERLDYMKAWEEFRTVRRDKLSAKRRKIRRTWMRYAAMFMIPLGVAVALLSRDDIKEKSRVEPITVKAGKSQAVLVLSSGERQVLDLGERNIEDGGMRISADSGRISYNGKSRSGEVQDAFHILEVPRGGEYFMILEDGTKVWLNAATRLKYPVAFVGGIRKVLLEGEAYFEVARDTSRPFVVETVQAKVSVLGTSFDVCAYAEEGKTWTTLEEGVVEVESMDKGEKVRMVPGEQVCLTGGKGMEKYKVETALFTSWRSGRLVFKDMRLEDLMRNMARWYDVKVEFYREEAKDIVFTGDVKKYEDLNEVLEIIELTSDVHFTIEEQRIIVH